ncbi:MAG TPA: amidohydrolase family protein [Candidatus Acidoferrales bacterium]|nr:amidohydrolase family protein [Candidatus Acidoferrales bacterium]
MNVLRTVGLTLLLLFAAFYIVAFWPVRDPHPAPYVERGITVVQVGKLYASPDAPALAPATIVIQDGRIAQVTQTFASAPANARVINCQTCTATAGFWNVHIHFTQPKWQWAAWKSTQILNAQLADMLTSRGFTTVADLGSDPRDTISLRRRIEHGDLLGPAIYTAGPALYPPDGIPYYLRNSLPRWMLKLMPQPKTPEAAVRVVVRNKRTGSDLLKLFTGSYVERGVIKPMPEDIASAAARQAHDYRQLVFAHGSNLAGTQVAIASGVDVLAHAPDTTEGVDEAVLRAAVARHMAMVPTLKMFATTVTTKPSYLQPIYAIVRQYKALGGELMFGTDVGYMTDYSTDGEFSGLKECGLNSRDMLRMLTTAPAARFGVANEKGTVEVGKLGDITVLDADPVEDTAAFSKVHATIRNGRVLFQK